MEEEQAFIAGSWRVIPTDAAMQELEAEANKVSPQVEFHRIDGRRPTTEYL